MLTGFCFVASITLAIGPQTLQFYDHTTCAFHWTIAYPQVISLRDDLSVEISQLWNKGHMENFKLRFFTRLVLKNFGVIIDDNF